MIRLKKIAAMLIALALLITFIPQLETSALAESDGMIRVKITRLGSPTSITFTTGCDYFVDGDRSVRIPSGSKVTVTISGSSLLLNCGSYSLNMGGDFTINRQYSGTSGVRFTNPALSNVYCGDFRFMLDSGKITTIMTIYIEDYLYGVVGYEMSNSYPEEALKTQAVAARNYALRAKQTRSSRAYDVVDTSSDQVFKGYNSSYKRAIGAVDSTRGMVLSYDGKLAACYYGSSNGGQTESTKNAWGSSLAYSVVKDDRFDLEGMGKCNSVTLKKDQTGVSMNAELRSALIAGMEGKLTEYGLSTDPDDIIIETILDIEPCNPKYAAPSILYKTLTFTIVASSVNAEGERISGTVSIDVPTYGGVESWFGLSIGSGSNETVIVTESDTAFTISFRRNGHGIGMSQHGARIMAMNYSMDYTAILDFYYPGTELVHVNLSDTTGKNLTQSGDSSGLETPIEPAATPKPESTAAPDQDAEPVMQAKVKLSSPSSKLNVRKGPSTSTAVVTLVKHGAAVDVYAIEGDWVAIGVGSYRGYVMKKYLVKAEDTPAAPTAAPTAQPTAAPEAGDEPVMQAKVRLSSPSSTLNMRRGPSTGTSVVTRLKHGAVVDVYSVSGSWVEIGVGNKRGYVMKKYLVEYVPDAAATPEPTAAPTPEPTAEPTAAPTAVPTNRPDEGEAPAMRAMVTLSNRASTLNMRRSPSTGSSVVTRLKHGAIVDVYSIDGSWVEIGYGGRRGYVMKKYLVEYDPEPAITARPTPTPEADDDGDGSTGVYAKVKLSSSSSRLKLRKGPGTSYGVRSYLNHGQRVEVLAVNGSWVKVMTSNGLTGYVNKGYLQLVETEKKSEDDSFTAIAVESTFVYSAADASASAVAGLEIGDKVTVIDYNSSWAKVVVGGVEGYVPTEDLKRAN